ncbi:phage tail protein [Lactiplantibacillus plantarum]|uniref:phage tail protein n=1 Tax=Lactiplantibacillus plantarum TaxID=1590 RepID=UPI001BAE1475|nr:phage tail protein [Lactiplantibacillus plantarum]MBS0937038.1 phage tail protein [Lactiplantibacillus plantarum]MBS0945138.1 phage tail protein [Lactiplantibacillus plantarum]
MNKDNILLVKGLHSTNVEPLTTAVNNTVQLEWEKNGTYQLSFTAYAGLEDLVAYEMLDVESSVFFDGQEFIVKQSVAEVQDSFTTKQVTATHVYNEVSRIRQTNVNSGEKTYTVDDILDFYLKDNTLGFTWKVIGSFDKQQITDLGGDSAKDCLSKITDTWPNAVIFPDNKLIQVYEQNSFQTNQGGRIDYLHDASDVQLTSDSTSIVNQVKAIGKEQDGSDSDKPSYYFDPFLVTDYGSVQKWGLHPGDDISDDRFTDKEAMRKYALSQMTTEPSLSITVTSEVNQKPIAGEVVRLEVRPMTFVTNVEVVGYTWYPFDKSQLNSITLNNNAKTIQDYQRRNKTGLAEVIRNQKTDSRNGVNALTLASQAYDSRMYGEVVGESEY